MIATTPADIARADQADAAREHAAGMLSVMARATGSAIHAVPGPVSSRLIRHLRVRLLREDFTLCRHLDDTSPRPAAWMASAPGRIRCVECAGQAASRIRGGREAYVCDGCGRRSRTVGPSAALLPAHHVPSVLRLPHPIVVHFGLCDLCRRADSHH